MSIVNLVNHQIRLAARPVGMPKTSDWSHTTEAAAEPADCGMTATRRWLTGCTSSPIEVWPHNPHLTTRSISASVGEGLRRRF